MADLGFAAGGAAAFTVAGETGPKNTTVSTLLQHAAWTSRELILVFRSSLSLQVFNCADVTLVANSNCVSPEYTCLNTVSSRQTRGSSKISSPPYSVSRRAAAAASRASLSRAPEMKHSALNIFHWCSTGRRRIHQRWSSRRRRSRRRRSCFLG